MTQATQTLDRGTERQILRRRTARSAGAFSPEFCLVLACLQWPLSDHEIEHIRAKASEVQDWPHVLAVAERHRVVGLVLRALTQAGCKPASEAAALFQRSALSATRLSMMLSMESARLGQRLSAEAVDCLFLKGVTVAVLAYGEAPLRHAKDIDLLVREAMVERATSVLREAGYLPLFDLHAFSTDRRTLWFRYAKSMDWMHPTTGIQLELHWRLTDLDTLRHLPSQQVQHVRVGSGCELDTLAPDALLAYLCVHGGAHGWMRLKWLADVRALLRGGPQETEATYRRVLALGTGRAAGLAFLLCHDLLDLPLPPSLLRELRRQPRLRLLRRSALKLLRRGNEVAEVHELPFGTTSVYTSRLLLGRGLRALGTELRTWGYRPDELLTSRLPQPLLFLFPLVRLGDWMASRLRHGGRSGPSDH